MRGRGRRRRRRRRRSSSSSSSSNIVVDSGVSKYTIGCSSSASLWRSAYARTPDRFCLDGGEEEENTREETSTSSYPELFMNVTCAEPHKTTQKELSAPEIQYERQTKRRLVWFVSAPCCIVHPFSGVIRFFFEARTSSVIWMRVWCSALLILLSKHIFVSVAG